MRLCLLFGLEPGHLPAVKDVAGIWKGKGNGKSNERINKLYGGTMGVSKDYLIELIFKTMPYSEQIKNLDTSDRDAVRFEWRSQSFRVSVRLSCDSISGLVREGSNISILLGALLEKQYAAELAAGYVKGEK